MRSDLQGIWFKGQYLPPMAGGSDDVSDLGSGDSGSLSAEGAASAYSTPQEPAGDYSPDVSDLGDDQSDASATPPEAWDPMAAISGQTAPQTPQAPAQPSFQAPPPPALVLQYQQATLIQQHQAEERELLTHLQYLPQDQAQELQSRWQALTVQRERQLVALQREQARAEMEPIAREASLDRLVEAAVHDNPGLDGKAMRAKLAKFPDARSVLIEAQEFANDFRTAKFQGRAQKGTDKMGSGAAYSASALKGRSTGDLLTMGLQELSKKTRR